MYQALWRILPGPLWLKLVQLLVISTAVLALLFFVAFPVIADTFFTEQSTLN